MPHGKRLTNDRKEKRKQMSHPDPLYNYDDFDENDEDNEDNDENDT